MSSATQHHRNPAAHAARGRMARTLVAAGLALVAAISLIADRGHTPDSPAMIKAASGALTVSNSLDGAAIFSSGEMGPGDSVTGDVTIANGSSVPTQLRLSQSDVVDNPGPYGGLLSERLDLVVTEGSDVVWSGKLGALPELDLGRLDPGQGHTYTFTVTLPDGGVPATASTGDNLFAGASTTVRYDWVSTEIEQPGPPPSAEPAAPKRSQPRLRLRLAPQQSVLRRGVVAIEALCATRCRLDAQAKLVGVNADRRGIRVRKSLKADTWTRINIKLGKRTVARIRRALRRGGKPMLRLTVTAHEADGRVTVARRRVKFSVRKSGRASVAVR